MEAFRVGLRNYQTSLVGAGLGSAVYARDIGLQLPDNQGQWISFIISLLLAILGILAKDATVGTKP